MEKSKPQQCTWCRKLLQLKHRLVVPLVFTAANTAACNASYAPVCTSACTAASAHHNRCSHCHHNWCAYCCLCFWPALQCNAHGGNVCNSHAACVILHALLSLHLSCATVHGAWRKLPQLRCHFDTAGCTAAGTAVLHHITRTGPAGLLGAQATSVSR